MTTDISHAKFETPSTSDNSNSVLRVHDESNENEESFENNKVMYPSVWLKEMWFQLAYMLILWPISYVFQRGLIEFAPGQVQRLRARITSKEAQHDPNGSAGSFDLIGQYQRLQNHQSPPTSRDLYRRRRRTSVPLQHEADRISPAHPDYHISAFLDENMRPPKFDVLLRQPMPSREVQEDNAWDSSQAGKSVNIYVRDDDKLTLHRHPVAQSTDCIRGKKGYSRGFHVWEIVWPLRQRGTHAVIGVCDKSARMQMAGYSSLIGSDEHSYGWDIIRNQGLHMAKTKSHWTYPDPALVDSSFQVPEKVYCILDMDEGYMAFATEEKYLGVAFRNLKGKALHPVVCAVWGHCEITMRYMGSLDPKPRSLMEICRRTIRLQLGPSSIDKADDLDLPNSLRDYVLFRPTVGSALL